MQNVPHSPAPWTASRMVLGTTAKDRRSGFVVNGPEADTLPIRICDIRCSPEAPFAVSKANGNLMAASPELLSSLQNMLQWANHFAEVLNDIEEHDGVPCGVAKDGPFAGNVTTARAAINKALGIAAD